ncbi:MAG: type I-U CRISPR-associated protein Csx17 [Polyangiaceae bacterium]|nr:type I-U CRISPR-associated protein Csx17 [Polyangiaceae bacterium]MCW5788786.1 type I-U CRISPR-associated protein Csx17 [Polyangiaceae bacterium]
MTVHLHHLRGCAPTPLAHYLKAIGILRIVAQQKDPEVRGFWRDQHFCLLTVLSKAELEAFFLEEYAPTPFLSPWNKGSGFYAANDKGLAPVERSRAPRFEAFRRGILEARVPLEAITNADAEVRRLKDQTKVKKGAKPARSKNDPDYKRELAAAEREFKRLKADLYEPFALAWRGPHRDWMDAAMVLSPEGEPSWPALLGTGGNDGRLDFTNTAMQRLGDLFDLDSEKGTPVPAAKSLLRTALFEIPSAALLDAAVGQFLPGSAGGANGTTGPDAGSRINPWDFVLMLEGAIAFRGQATRRLGVRESMQAAIPFAVTSQAVGHATRGGEKDLRGEQWMPFWEHPASWEDVSALFGEGRAQVGRSSARRPLDFARAIARLGVSRGLAGFVRYGYLERNGQSNLAVPLGRIAVAAHPRARLIDEISGWLDRLEREARDAPARFSVAVDGLTDAVFDVLTRDAEPARWQSVLVAINGVERAQASGTAFKIGPCPRLSSLWLAAAGDESPEWRLALALGSAARRYKEGRPFDSVRAHALPLNPKKSWSYAVGADKRLLNDSRVVMTGRDPVNDLISLVDRRLVEASQRGSRTLPLVAQDGAGARLADLSLFLAGEVDVERVVTLGRTLMALDWAQVRLPRVSINVHDDRPDEAWEALRLCTLPFDIHRQAIAAEPAMVRRLAGGDVPGAVEFALRRLRASGFRPPLAVATADPATARRWAAALAFPINPVVAAAMADRFENPTARETA